MDKHKLDGTHRNGILTSVSLRATEELMIDELSQQPAAALDLLDMQVWNVY